MANAKLTSAEVLYMEAPHKAETLSCGNCAHFNPRGACELMRERDVIESDDICGLWVPGEPDEDLECRGLTTPEIAGYGAGNTSCSTCQFGGKETCGHPSLNGFEIQANGCCNAWRERKGATLSQHVAMRFLKTKEQLRDATRAAYREVLADMSPEEDPASAEPDSAEVIAKLASGEHVWKLKDGWGTYYLLDDGNDAEHVAVKYEDVMCFNVSNRLRPEFDNAFVKKLGMGDTAWDAAVVKVLEKHE